MTRWLTIVCVSVALGGVARPAAAEHHLQVDTWTAADGLPQNTVTGITQDRHGYVWVATRKGLARFDGLVFRPVGMVDGVDLSTLRLTALAADDAGGLWVGTYAAGLLYLKDDHVTRHGTDVGVPDGTIWDVHRDPTGCIWIATPEGPRVRETNGHFVAPALPDDLDDSVNGVHVDRQGRRWFATSTRGVVRMDGTEARGFSVAEGLPHGRAYTITEDQHGTTWVGTAAGVARFDDQRQRFVAVDGLRDTRAYQVLAGRDGALWVATYGRGLLRHDIATGVTRRAEGIDADFILSLLEDREGSIWVGTVSSGMSRLTPVTRDLLDTRRGLPNFPVTTVYQDRAGPFWVGTLGGGLVWIDGDVTRRLTTAQGLPSDNITSVAGGVEDDTLWVGTTDAGVFQMRRGAVIRHIGPDTVGTNVRTAEYARGDMYFAGTGLVRLSADGSIRRWGRDDGLGSHDIRVLFGTEEGLFIGTFGGGLSRLAPDGTLTTWGAAEGLDNPFVTSIHVDDTGTAWIGTYGGGLYRLLGGRLDRISERDGLEDNVIFDIMEDRQQRLWLMMNQGISVVAIADAHRVANRTMTVLPSAFVGRAEGVAGIDGTDGNQPQSWLARDGRLWFATTHGVMIIDPGRVTLSTAQPTTHLDAVRVGDEPVPLGAPLRLAGRDLIVEYSTPQLRGASRVRYQHRLVGYDDSWSPPDQSRSTTYTNLPPGTYRFQVRAQGWRGAPFGPVRTLGFTVAPRYYETSWFRGLVGLLLLGALMGAYRYRVRRMEQREETLQQLVDTRTAALRHEMHERDRAERERRALDERVQQAQRLESLGMLAGGIAHDFNNLLVGVLGEAGLALLDAPPGSRVRSHLQRIEQAALQASELTSQMLAYSGRGRFVQVAVSLPDVVRDTARLLSSLLGRDVTLVLEFPDTLPPVEGDPSQLRQVVMNLLTNASDAIGSQPGRLRVAAGTQVVDAAMAEASAGHADGALVPGLYVWLTVEDDGEGMDETTMARIFEPFFSTKFTGRGLGLAAVQGIVRSHRGRIEVTSRRGVGTTFSVLLPAASSAAPEPAPVVVVPPQLRPSDEGKGSTILVVDDERTVRDVARTALEIAGFTVEVAVSGEDAVELFRVQGARIGLVLLDLTLPGISGRKVFEAIRALHPDVPILLTSGYSVEEAADIVSQPGAAFLPKPWRPHELVEQAHRLMRA